jgi:hypothetical protein
MGLAFHFTSTSSHVLLVPYQEQGGSILGRSEGQTFQQTTAGTTITRSTTSISPSKLGSTYINLSTLVHMVVINSEHTSSPLHQDLQSVLSHHINYNLTAILLEHVGITSREARAGRFKNILPDWEIRHGLLCGTDTKCHASTVHSRLSSSPTSRKLQTSNTRGSSVCHLLLHGGHEDCRKSRTLATF